MQKSRSKIFLSFFLFSLFSRFSSLQRNGFFLRPLCSKFISHTRVCLIQSQLFKQTTKEEESSPTSFSRWLYNEFLYCVSHIFKINKKLIIKSPYKNFYYLLLFLFRLGVFERDRRFDDDFFFVRPSFLLLER